MNIKEIAVGGVWCASAIGVAGWTWQAYTQQYSKFPGPGDGPGSSPFDWQSLLLGPLAPIAKAVEGAVGTVVGGLSTAPKALKESPQGIAKARAQGVHPGPGR